ncbi:hypothetical protein ABIA33_005848 [Streptacidiphilus sp. MAP12-16]|uniref:hypothetical protein n=1 Tax=Streptacidiphilus sp. MAP12-16 TaxID=3156300 RepID=UPI0035120B8D
MKINWAALGSTFGVSLLITLGVVAAFSFGISSLSRRETALAGGTAAGRGGAAVSTAVAVVCFGACAAAVGYGLYLIAGA